MHKRSGGGSIRRSVEERGHGAELGRIVRDVGEHGRPVEDAAERCGTEVEAVGDALANQRVEGLVSAAMQHTGLGRPGSSTILRRPPWGRPMSIACGSGAGGRARG